MYKIKITARVEKASSILEDFIDQQLEDIGLTDIKVKIIEVNKK